MFFTGPASWGSALRKSGLTVVFVAAGLASGGLQAKSSAADSSTVSLVQLPPEARKTDSLIRSGGPFPYPKDGVVFGNRERLLPKKPRGHYREYTVPTPGSRDRGARRIVCGGEKPTEPEACYYSADHYASFSRIVK